jgi:hypothetical protein
MTDNILHDMTAVNTYANDARVLETFWMSAGVCNVWQPISPRSFTQERQSSLVEEMASALPTIIESAAIS